MSAEIEKSRPTINRRAVVAMQGKLRVGAHRLNNTTLDRNRLCPWLLVVAGKDVPVQQQHVARAQGVTPDKHERESAKAALP